MQQTVLITGCTPGGIGHAVATGLKEAGYRVFATARRPEVVATLEEAGFEATILDVTSQNSISEALTWVKEQTGGRLDALFNNAGYGQPGAVEDLSTEALKAQLETNFFGLHRLTSQVIPIMRAQGHGRIIMHSSILGLVGLRFRGAYNASKFALEGLTDTLRLELAGSGIYVSTINTGPVTSRFRQNAYEAFKRNINREQSVFAPYYVDAAARFESSGKDRFEKGPEAVLEKVRHALESSRPRSRYYVTTATYLLGGFKRLLPTGMMDILLRKVV